MYFKSQFIEELLMDPSFYDINSSYCLELVEGYDEHSNKFWNILDYKTVMAVNGPPQAFIVIFACIVNIFNQVWKARNISRFEDKKIHWKRCITIIVVQDKLVGNITTKISNFSPSRISLSWRRFILANLCKPRRFFGLPLL